MQAAIEARAVSYRPRSGEITVRDISMTIDHGELVAIIGSRGSGKTTLLDTLSGLVSPSSGTVRRGSRDAGPPASGRAGAAGWRVGYVPDGGTIHPFFPLGRALRYSAELRGAASPGDDGDDAVEEALRVVNLAGQAPAQVADLNPGERKRAAIAAELLAGPAQLFLDEPTAGLDPAQATEVMRLLRRLSDGGLTVVLTTSSSLDAARCDKVAVLAAGGHLAFFGTPAAARGYFGADSLEEIYERLAGLGDPAAAWSRRFFQFSRTRAAFPPVPPVARAPGPAALVPDVAGPHSAGRPGLPEPEGEEEARADPEPVRGPASFPDSASPAGDHPADRPGGWLRPVRQLFVLIRQNTELTARSWLARTVLAGAPAAVLLSYGLLIGVGAFDSPAAGSALIVLGGSSIGLAYGLSHDREEGGALRAERFAGLSAATYVLAKLAVLLPALAAADAVALLVPAACSRLPHGFGPSYLTVLLSSTLALALGLLLAVTVQGRPALAGPRAAVIAPAAIFAAALLSLLDRPAWWTWLLLAAVTAVLLAAVTVAIARRDPRPR